jgi:hypothetical protein
LKATSEHFALFHGRIDFVSPAKPNEYLSKRTGFQEVIEIAENLIPYMGFRRMLNGSGMRFPRPAGRPMVRVRASNNAKIILI